MSKRTEVLLQRRAYLLEKIATQREQLAELGTRWQRPLRVADQGLALLSYIRHHPILLGGSIVVLMVRRRGVLAAFTGAWRIWKLYSRVRDYSKHIK